MEKFFFSLIEDFFHIILQCSHSRQSNSTISNIYQLSEEESIKELARMLGGVKITEAVLQNAREMRALAKQ